MARRKTEDTSIRKLTKVGGKVYRADLAYRARPGIGLAGEAEGRREARPWRGDD